LEIFRNALANRVVNFKTHEKQVGITNVIAFNCRQLVRNYGRGPRGWRIQAPIPASWGPRISAIIVTSQQDIQLCRTTTRAINGERFISFVRNQLVLILKPYNGQSPNSIVIMGKFVKLVGFFFGTF